MGEGGRKVAAKNSGYPYAQSRRARQTEARRTAILDAAEALLVARPAAETSVDEIAERADVARATVFTQFGSKGGLLAALVERMSESAGTAHLVEAMNTLDPIAALDAVVEVGTRLWADKQPLYTALVAAAQVDRSVAATLEAKDADRCEAIGHLVARLAANGRLAAGVTEDDAARIFGLLTSFGTYEQLAAGDGPPRVAPLLRRLMAAVVPALPPNMDCR